MSATSHINEILDHLHGQFYADDFKAFSHQKDMLLKAITYPAAFLEGKKSVRLSEDRYKEIVLAVVQDIKRHGDTGNIKFFAGYLLGCVQKHMQYHWEEYYNEGRSARNLAERTMLGIKDSFSSSKPDTAASIFYELHNVLKSKRGRRSVRSAKQGELL